MQNFFNLSHFKGWDVCLLTSPHDLLELALFIARQNLSHHLDVNHEIVNQIYQEEIGYFSDSFVFVLLNPERQIVASIRIMKWDQKIEIPMQRYFVLNNSDLLKQNYIYWHIGRLAVDKKQRGNCFTIFKYLMGIASYFVCMDSRGCMLAEIDSRLFHTINHLGMKLTELSDLVYFLGSESIAAYALRDSIMEYYLKCISEYDYSFIKKIDKHGSLY